MDKQDYVNKKEFKNFIEKNEEQHIEIMGQLAPLVDKEEKAVWLAGVVMQTIKVITLLVGAIWTIVQLFGRR